MITFDSLMNGLTKSEAETGEKSYTEADCMKPIEKTPSPPVSFFSPCFSLPCAHDRDGKCFFSRVEMGKISPSSFCRSEALSHVIPVLIPTKQKLGMKTTILKGDTYGFLTILSEKERDVWGNVKHRCRCRCGKEKFFYAWQLTSGDSVSCGCWKSERITMRNRKGKGERV